jgi:glycosyltransferase involved in cell wall biosynthesis
VRTREIHSRLSARHEITAVVAAYPTARQRVEGGIHWTPVGTRTGTALDRLSYFARVGAMVRSVPHDLVVEDFSAPFGPAFAPSFTDRPVVASVQWLFAGQMTRKYGVPFHLVEQAGLKHYDRFIAVSQWTADEIHRRRPGATVHVIPNGLDRAAFETHAANPRHLLFIGRLDVQQKGCDLLIDAYARAGALLGNALPPLVVVGDGPDEDVIRRRASEKGVLHRIEFRGRVEGAAKYHAIAGSYAVLMPSRFETFGMVAAEAMAAGAPVVAFDVGPLPDVAGPGGARLVPAFDLDAFAQEIVALSTSVGLRDRLRESGREWVRRYDWDDLALAQERVYEQALGDRSGLLISVEGRT